MYHRPVALSSPFEQWKQRELTILRLVQSYWQTRASQNCGRVRTARERTVFLVHDFTMNNSVEILTDGGREVASARCWNDLLFLLVLLLALALALALDGEHPEQLRKGRQVVDLSQRVRK